MKNGLISLWKIVKFILTVLLLLAFGYLIFLLLKGLFHQIGLLSDNVIAAFVASSAAVFGYWYTQQQSKAKEITESHRPKKIEIYQIFMDILIEFLKSARDNKPIDPKNISEEIRDKFDKLNIGMILWGSPSMVKTWLHFRSGSQEKPEKAKADEKPKTHILILMDDVLRAIRKDLGNSNTGLNKGELIKIFLKDPEELDKIISGKK